MAHGPPRDHVSSPLPFTYIFAAALERILRLLQALSQVLVAYSLSIEDAKVWLHLRKQFALGTKPLLSRKSSLSADNFVLGRRYFRFFKFLECFSKAWSYLYESTGIDALLGTGKWSCQGIYLACESLTIVSNCYLRTSYQTW